MTRTTFARAAAAITLTLSLGACASDYAGHTDRIAYSSGNAVKANMAIQTINPSKASMYKTGGLGRTGPAITSNSAAAPSP